MNNEEIQLNSVETSKKDSFISNASEVQIFHNIIYFVF